MVEGRYPSDDIFRGDVDPQVRKKKSAAAKSIERRAAASKSPRSQLKRGLALLAGKTEELPQELRSEADTEATADTAALEPTHRSADAGSRRGRGVRVLSTNADTTPGVPNPEKKPSAAPRARRLFGRAAEGDPAAEQFRLQDDAQAEIAPNSSTADLFAPQSFGEDHAATTSDRSGDAFFEEEPTYIERPRRFFSRSHAESARDEAEPGNGEFDHAVQYEDEEPIPDALTGGFSGGVKRFLSRVTHAALPEEELEPATEGTQPEVKSGESVQPALDQVTLNEDEEPIPDALTGGFSGGVKRFLSRVAQSLQAEEEPTQSAKSGTLTSGETDVRFEPDVPTRSSELTDSTIAPVGREEPPALPAGESYLNQRALERSAQNEDEEPIPDASTGGLPGGVKRFFSRAAQSLQPEAAGNPSGSDEKLSQEDVNTADRMPSPETAVQPGRGHDLAPMRRPEGLPPAFAGLADRAKRFFFRVEEVEPGVPEPWSSLGADSPSGRHSGTGTRGHRASAARPGKSIVAQTDAADKASSLAPGSQADERLSGGASPGEHERAGRLLQTATRRPSGRHFAASESKWEPPKWNLDAESDLLPPAPSSRPSAPSSTKRAGVGGAARARREAATDEGEVQRRPPRRPGSRGPSSDKPDALPLGRTSRETVALVISICLILAIVLGIGNLRTSAGLAAGKTSAADLAPSTTVVAKAPPTTAASIPVTTTPPTTVVVTTTTTTQPKLAAGANPANAQVTVRVANGTGVAGAAGRITQKLQSLDFNVVVPINATVSNLGKTTVYYYAGFQVAGQAIAEILGLPASAAKPLTSAAPLPNIYPSDVNVVLGADVAG